MHDVTKLKMNAGVEELLKLFDQRTEGRWGFERALFVLLNAYRYNLPEIDDGISFHKAFRQTDVTPNGTTDTAIWLLLHESVLFWECLDEIKKASPTN